MPFKDASVDAVLCKLGLLHVPDRQAALSEVRCVLRSVGLFGSSNWAAADANPGFSLALTSIGLNSDPERPPSSQADFFGLCAVESAKATLRMVGFEVKPTALSEMAWSFEDAERLCHNFSDATVRTATAKGSASRR